MQMKQRKLASWAFYFLLVALALDLISTLVNAPADRSGDLLIVVTLYYAGWIGCSLLTAFRIAAGNGRVCGAILLTAFLVAVMLAVAISLSLGVNDYKPPLIVWMTHAIVIVSYLTGAVCLARIRSTESEPGRR